MTCRWSKSSLTSKPNGASRADPGSRYRDSAWAAKTDKKLWLKATDLAADRAKSLQSNVKHSFPLSFLTPFFSHLTTNPKKVAARNPDLPRALRQRYERDDEWIG